MYIEIDANNLTADGLRKYEEINIYFQGYVIWEDKLYFDKEFDPVLVKHFNEHSLEENCVHYNGIFNLVILKGNELIVIRDRWGIVPLYYTRRNEIYALSEDWEQLCASPDPELNEAAMLELITLGYSLGSKTMLSDVHEFQPHTIYRVNIGEGSASTEDHSYWNLELPLPKKKSSHLDLELKDLWQSQIAIYTDYIKENGNSVFMPFSGGLDCRLLAHELDKEAIELYALTFGRGRNDEVVSAQNAVQHLRYCKSHHILEMNKENTASIFNKPGFSERITCAFPSELLHYYSAFTSRPAFMMTGFSGDFMAGSHLKYKMRFWKSREDIVDFIVNFKSTALLKDLCNRNTKEGALLKEELYKAIPDGPNLLSSFIRWDVEQRQRRYIARSAFVKRAPDSPRVLLPFFDYKLMDFFNGLSLHDLWNARLYTNTQLKHLYHDNPGLISAERVGKRQKTIRNNFIYEFTPKFRLMVSKFLGKNKPMDSNIYLDLDFNAIMGNMNLPDYLKNEKLTQTDYPINNLYIYSVSEAYKKIKKL